MLRVALRCGFPTVRHFEEAYSDMTAREVVELMAMDALDPPLGQRLDYLVALLCAVVANSRMAKKGAKAFKPADFFPKWGGRKQKKLTPEQLSAQAKQIFGAMARE